MPKTRGAVKVGQASPGTGLLREQAYQQLKVLVLSGQLAKMPFLSERGLAKHLGMSNTPVRSAVERLELEGMLSIGPQRGIEVRELSPDEIVDHFEIRQSLETLVVRKLAGRLSREQADALHANVAAHEAGLQAGDIQEYITRDGDFHLLLAEFSGNADVERVLRQLRDRIFRVVLRVIEHVPRRMRESVDEHRRIVDLLLEGDAEGASKLMTQHLRGGLKAIVPSFQEDDIEI
jgi:DNA-binding GntR family transcriptional regulator